MSKRLTQLEKTIAAVEAEMDVLMAVKQRLIAQQKIQAVRGPKPRAVSDRKDGTRAAAGG